MNTYEKQLQSAADKEVLVIENWYMGNDPDHEPIDGLYLDGCVALSSDLQTTAEKSTVLAEELAHHDLTVGDILDLSDAGNRRQEQKARTLSYDRLIGLPGLARAFGAGCESRYEVAEYLEVTESFLQEAIDRYKEIYGPEFSVYIEKHLKEEPHEIRNADPVPKQKPAAAGISPEEIQKRIERIRKHRKKLSAAIRKRNQRVAELIQNGHDFFATAEEQYLDSDRNTNY